MTFALWVIRMVGKLKEEPHVHCVSELGTHIFIYHNKWSINPINTRKATFLESFIATMGCHLQAYKGQCIWAPTIIIWICAHGIIVAKVSKKDSNCILYYWNEKIWHQLLPNVLSFICTKTKSKRGQEYKRKENSKYCMIPCVSVTLAKPREVS